MSHQDIWEEYDQRQAGTAYWEHITDPQQAFEERLVWLIRQYPIDYPGRTFIMQSCDALLC